jgi:AsmA-like C-terminal region/AsmA family
MLRHRKILLALLAGAGFLLTLLTALLLLAPRLINTVTFKERVLTLLERETGVRLSFARAEVTLFPRPRVAVRGVGLDVPGLVHGTVAVVEADPELLPLFRGEVRIASVLLEAPDLRVRLPAKESPVSLEEIEKGFSSLLASLRQRIPGTVVTIRNARLELSDGDGPIVSLRELEARIALPPDRLTVHVRCASRYWESLSMETSVRPEGLRAETRIETAGLRVRELAERLSPGAAPWLGETVLSLRGRIDSEGVRSAKAEIAGAMPILTIRRGSRSRAVRVGAFKGALDLDERGIRATLSDLALDEPRLRLSGDLAVDRGSPRIELKLTGQGMEIAPVRDTLLALAGDVPTVRDILDVVRGGILPRFSLQSGGRSPGELGDLDALRFQATLSGGSIRIPGPDLALEEVGADVTMAKGILEGKGIAARLGNARATGGSLRIGFADDDPPFHAEFLADADVGELPPLLRRLVQGGVFREELDRIREVRGNASGQVVLGERLSSVGVRFTASKVRLAAKYDRIPFPVAVDDGSVSYDGASVAVTDLGGRVGKSSFSGVTGQVGLSEAMALSVTSGRAHLDLGELYPWITSFDGIRGMGMEVRSLRGVADVGPLSLAGPLRGAGEWTFDAAGNFFGMELDTPLLPGPLSAPTGRFRFRPASAIFSGVEASLLDAKVRGTAEFRLSGGGVSQADGTLEGEVGEESIRWVSSRLQAPPEFAIRAPLSATAAVFSWERRGGILFKADFHRPGGAVLSVSLRKTPEELTIDSLVLRDPESAFSLAIHLGPKELRLKFKGTLYRSTVEKFVAIPADPFRYLKGDLNLSVDLESPNRSDAMGTLEGEGIRIPWKPLDPLLIRSASLSAERGVIRVVSSDLVWREIPFRLRGEGSFSGEGLEADVDVETGDVPLERLLPQTPESTKTAADSGGPPVADAGYHLPKLPVRGFLRLRSDSIRYGRWTANSVTARGELGAESLHVKVSEGDLCRFPLQVSATLDSKGLAVELQTSASGEDLKAPLLCLLGQHIDATGSYRFDARLSARGGDPEALLRSIEGPWELTARDGRIYKWSTLSKILALLNVTNVLRGKFPDFREKGLPYQAAKFRGDYKGQVLRLTHGTLYGPTIGMAGSGKVDFRTSQSDFKVLVAPFRTADWIIRNIPLVRYVMKKTFVSVPFTVKGDYRDPSVWFDPVGVGTGLLGVMERIIKLPVKILEYILPGSKPQKENGGGSGGAGEGRGKS